MPLTNAATAPDLLARGDAGDTASAHAPDAPSAAHGGAVLRYGGLAHRATVAEQLALPVLSDLTALVKARDALDQAVTERKGVALLGEKGAGKTIAVDRAVQDFDDAEDERVAQDAGWERRIVLRVHAPRAKRRVEILNAVHRALTGAPMELTARGARIQEDQLLEELVDQLLQASVAALVVDEAEHLHDAGLDVLRDIISSAETRSAQRYVGDRYRAVGVGILLVGTPDLKARLSASTEAGRRWLRIDRIGTLTPRRAADVYRRFLRCFDAEAARRGDAAWYAFIAERVCPERVPIAHIENHVRHYVRRMVNSDPSLHTADAIPFDEDIFLGTWTERAGQAYREPLDR